MVVKLGENISSFFQPMLDCLGSVSAFITCMVMLNCVLEWHHFLQDLTPRDKEQCKRSKLHICIMWISSVRYLTGGKSQPHGLTFLHFEVMLKHWECCLNIQVCISSLSWCPQIVSCALCKWHWLWFIWVMLFQKNSFRESQLVKWLQKMHQNLLLNQDHGQRCSCLLFV